VNGDPVLFSAYAKAGDAVYGFACTSCGLNQADQPDTLCGRCAKPKRTRRPARKTTTAKR
jgi:hypothetical protein